MEHSKEAAWGEMQKAGYIAEDAIPRIGGQWPEYAHTLKICVDSFDAQLAEGTLFTYYFENAWAFHSLDQLLFALDSVAQLAGQPQADTELRRGFAAPVHRRKPVNEGERTWTQPKHQIPYYTVDELKAKHGRLANFHLRIFARQHSRMQGVLVWEEGKKEMTFRSELELLLLLRDALLASDGLPINI